MTIQNIIQERNNTLLQLAQAHTKAGEVRAELERLNALAVQLAVEIRNLEAIAAGLGIAMQAMAEQPASGANGAKESPAAAST